MHIEFLRTGGFGGLRLATTVNTDRLPAEQASTVSRLISDAGFFQLPEKLLPPSPMPDRFQYKVTISDPDKTHSIEASDPAIPEALRPLLNYLTTMAMTRKNP
ncbi:MAG TPA: protealysin inhibitor emfourin [Anaerolineales bacterium]|nr:protealysin inhibitor emfourin [Anaerolineales bacterium]